MLPDYLVPEQVVRSAGYGPIQDLGPERLVRLTLGITRIIEQESLSVAIYGSKDGRLWREKPLAEFPKSYFNGVYTLVLDLSQHPEIRYFRAGWAPCRWGRVEKAPLFGFYLHADLVMALASTA